MNTISSRPMLPGRPILPAAKAVPRFLGDMQIAAARNFPAWAKILTEGIDDCGLGYDGRRAVLEIHPLDDYFLAGVIALEAAKVRQFLPPPCAAEVLGLVAEQVDALAGRTDRLVSELVFYLIGLIDLTVGTTAKLPHDQVVRGLLERLGIHKNERTAHLMRAILFRHTLGEPLACGVPQWWTAFQRKYTLAEAVPGALLSLQTPLPKFRSF